MTGPQRPPASTVFTPALDGPGTQPILIASRVPGLAIVREEGARECWGIFHSRSGSAIILDLAGLATAEWASEDLGELLDWTKDRHELTATADLLVYVEPAIERIAARHGGITLGTEAVYVLW